MGKLITETVAHGTFFAAGSDDGYASWVEDLVEGLDSIYGLMLRDNARSIELFKEKGFAVDYSTMKKATKATLALQ